MERGKKAPQWGFPRRCYCPLTKALDSGHSGDFPGGATLSVSSQVNRRVARTSRSRAAPPEGDVTAPSLVFLPTKRVHMHWMRQEKRYTVYVCEARQGEAEAHTNTPPPATLLRSTPWEPRRDLVRTQRDEPQHPESPRGKPEAKVPRRSLLVGGLRRRTQRK